MNPLKRLVLISLLVTLVLIAGWSELSRAATQPGGKGDPVHYADTDTIDVPFLRQNGVLVGTAAGNPIVSVRPNQALPASGPSAVIQHAASTLVTEIVKISSNGGALTSSATPRILAGVNGQTIILQGTSATNTYTIPDGSGILWSSAAAVLFNDLTSRVLTYDSTISAWREAVSTTGGYGLVQDESLVLPSRATLNFLGAGVSCADNAGALRTDCTIPGGGGSTSEWAPVAVATTTNINLSAPGTVHDGVTLAVTTPRTRFLAWQQTTLSQNGIFTFEGGATPAIRATDADLGSEFVNNMAVYVQTGTLYGGDVFRLATTGTIVVNSSNLTFVRFPSVPHAELQANKNVNSGYMGLTTAGKAPWNRTWSYAAHADLAAATTIDVLSLLSSQGANVIGIQSATAGNLNHTANPHINGCTAANDGTRILLAGIDPVKTVTIPNGQGVLLVGATGSVIVGQPPGGTSVEFRCRGSTTIWEQVGGGGGGGGATGRDFFGLTSTSNCVRMGLDASNHICIYTSGGVTRIEGYTAGALNATSTTKLGSGGNFQVLSDTDAVLFNVSNAGVVTGLAASDVLMGNTTAGNLTCSSGGDQSYYSVVGRTGGTGSTDATSAQPYPKAGAAYRLRVVSNGNVPSGQTLVTTLRKNGSNSALTCTMSAGTSTCTGSLGVGSEVAVAQDDLLVLGALCTGGTTALNEVSWGVLIR